MINLGRLDFWVNNKTISQSQESQQLLKEIQQQPPDVFYKKESLKILQNSRENTCGRISFLIKLQAWGNFFTEHLRTTASGNIKLFRLKAYSFKNQADILWVVKKTLMQW